MAVTSNIGNTSRIITQRDFFRNLSEFYSGSGCTDNEVDSAAQYILNSNENLITWSNGTTYEPLKALPNFTVNKTGNTKSFWGIVSDAVDDNRNIYKYFPEYTVNPFNTTGISDKQLIPESACTTFYDTTIQQYGNEIKFKFDGCTAQPNVDLNEYDIDAFAMTVSASTMNDDTNRLFSVIGSANNKSLRLNETMTPYGSNYLVMADKSLPTTNVNFYIQVSGTFPPLNTSTGVPLTLNSVPTFSDQNGEIIKHPSAKLLATGPTSAYTYYFAADINYQNPITYGNLPNTININLNLGKIGNKTNVFLEKLSGVKPSNYTGMTFTSGNSSIGMVSLKLDDTRKVVKPKWCAAYADAKSQIPDGFANVVAVPFYPYVDDMENGAYHLVRYNTSTPAQSGYGYVPSPAVQTPYGIWILPITATNTKNGTNPTTGMTIINTVNMYVHTANAYIASRVIVSRGPIYFNDTPASFNEGEYNMLVPPKFTVYSKNVSGSTKPASAQLIYIDENGVEQNAYLTGYQNSNGSVTYTWDPNGPGGDVLIVTSS